MWLIEEAFSVTSFNLNKHNNKNLKKNKIHKKFLTCESFAYMFRALAR